MNKPTVLLVTDSAHLDTGFGRVAREIGIGLVRSGKFNVVQHGWFHIPSDKLIPFCVIPTIQSGKGKGPDAYGEQSYDAVVQHVKPDIVLVVGDEWAIRHIVSRPRSHKLVGYVPIDAAPLNPEWVSTLKGFDKLVLYGQFAKHTVEWADSSVKADIIPHGVDLDTFCPVGDVAGVEEFRRQQFGEKWKFIIGCVSRNTARKKLPRLIKAFRKFIQPATTCPECSNVFTTDPLLECPACHNTRGLAHTNPKHDALLYMHTVPTDAHGFRLVPLIARFKLQGYVAMPDGMKVARGVPDSFLNMLYNSFDVFTLPTGGEGFGLPLLEAMSAGCPSLAPNYSGHVDFMREGGGELIEVSEMETCISNNGERALANIEDYVMKLDRFYYEPEEFVKKWGPRYRMLHGEDALANIMTGNQLRRVASECARNRAEEYGWPSAIEKWVQLLSSLVDWDLGNTQAVMPYRAEVL